MAWQSFPTFASRDRWKKWDQNRCERPFVYQAAGDSLHEDQGCAKTPEHIPGILRCRGIKLGTIQKIGGAYQHGGLVELQNAASKTETGSIYPFDKIPSMGNRLFQTKDAVWRTITLNRKDMHLDEPAPLDFKTQFQWLCLKALADPANLPPALLLWFRHNAAIVCQDSGASEALLSHLNSVGYSRASVDFTDEHSDRSPLTDLERQMLHTWRDAEKRLAELDDGNLAMIPKHAQYDGSHHAFALAGCSFAAVLRGPDPAGRYRLVGECYVDGKMQREAVASGHDTDTTREEINLC
jgi:hypothetical protein